MKRPIDETIGSWGACAPDADTWTVSGKSTWWDAAIKYAREEASQIDGVDPELGINIHEERAPAPPEALINAGTFIDNFLSGDGHDDYSCDFCDYLSGVTEEQERDLEQALRAAVGAWLDKYKLRPTWKVGGRSWVVTYSEAKARAEAAKEAE